MGPYVTKFTLGVIDEDDSDYPTPVVTIAMPTVNLMRMVQDMQGMFLDPGFKADCVKMIALDAKRYFSVPGLAQGEDVKTQKRIPRAGTRK